MGIPPYERSKLHHGDEPGKIHNLRIGVSTIEDTRKIEEFSSGIDFGPESFFESFFCGRESGCFFDKIEVGQNAYNFGETV